VHGNHDLLHDQGRYADGHEHDGDDARLLRNVHDVREYDDGWFRIYGTHLYAVCGNVRSLCNGL